MRVQFEFIDTYHAKLDENAMGVIMRELLRALGKQSQPLTNQ